VARALDHRDRHVATKKLPIRKKYLDKDDRL